MPQDFTGKVIAISGAASGIGLATAQHLYSLGASVSITDIRRDALAQAIQTIASTHFTTYTIDPSKVSPNTKEIQAAADGDTAVDVSSDAAIIPTNNPRILAVTTDVRSSAQVDRWISLTVSHLGRLDGAATPAGVISRHIGTGTILDTTDADWAFVLGINMSGVFYAMRAQVRAMKGLIEDGTMQGACIVNASSISGVRGDARNADYAAAKHGVVGLTKSVAREWGKVGIRCNAVAPGVVATPMVQTLPQAMSDGIDFALEHKQPLGRRAQPVEIGKLIAFLLSEDASFITGATYVADGGQIC